MSLEPPSPLARNVAALRLAQPEFELPPGGGTVQPVNGAWRLQHADGSAVAIHSRNPEREADQAVERLLAAAVPDVIVVIGLALGYVGDALERRGWGGKLLAIEPEPATIAPLLERRDWTAWIEGDRLRILVAPQYRGAVDCWRWFDDVSTEPVTFVHPVFERIRSGEVAAARAVLKRVRFDAASNAEARRTQGARYLLNTLRNLPAIAAEPGVAALRGAASRVPAIIVAAGPSLDSSLAAVRDMQDRALIIAVDTALRPLLSAGVRPHAVVAVDPSEANGRHLVDLPPSGETFLIAEGSIDPFAVAGFSGRTFFFSVSDHHPWPWLRSLGVDTGQLRAWGSVLTSAFDLALVMGADPVMFVGADLSYPGDRPYCRGVSFEEDWRRGERWGTPMVEQWRRAIDQWGAVFEPDVAGAPVRTAPHLVAFRDWLVEQMSRHSGERRFVNAGGAGILHGMAIEQITPSALTGWPRPGTPVDSILPGRYRPRSDLRVAEATTRVLEGMEGDQASSPLHTWLGFAPGLARETVADALRLARRHFAGVGSPSPPPVPLPAAPVTDVEADYLRELAPGVAFVPFEVPPHRMESAVSGARMFRFRTTAAAVMCCAMRTWKDGMAEDGGALTRAYDMDAVAPGTYVAARDVIHFRATDGSDPRTNGRRYTVIVPAPVAYLEALPLADIVAHDL